VGKSSLTIQFFQVRIPPNPPIKPLSRANWIRPYIGRWK
jgi:hypothetical protein